MHVGVKQAVTPEIVAKAAAELMGGPPGTVVELMPRGTLRSFRVEGSTPLTIRVDEDPAGRRVDVEAKAFVALQTATSPAIVPTLRTRHVLFGRDGIERRYLAYDWIDGRVLEAPLPRARAVDVGVLFARLHGARVMDLQGRLPDGQMSLLDVYRKTADELRGWIALREQDGLGHDLLTLSLSDTLRALRAVVVAQDNAFRTARRRVLSHGAPEPAYLVARAERGPMTSPLMLVGLDRAVLGDAAFDLARFAVASELCADEDAEDALLSAYLDELAAQERRDPRFIVRYFAARTLELLARPVSRLERIARIKRGTEPVLDDPVGALEREAEIVAVDIARALTALRDLTGRARPTTPAEVKAMGRIVAIEDLVLAGRTFRIALGGEPYTGKTEVGALLARRLQHRFIGTGAVSRALALVERDARAGKADTSPRALVKGLFDKGFVMEPLVEPPFYRVLVSGEDLTEYLREADGDLVIRAGALLDDERVRQALKDELERRFVGEGLVVEGLYAESVLGSRVRTFHLVGDVGVRRARLMAHRQDDLDDDSAAALLRRLDAEAPKPPPDATAVDVGSRPAAAAALAVLVHLLPASRRGAPDLSNRAPL
jgi:cytidylate kinase